MKKYFTLLLLFLIGCSNTMELSQIQDSLDLRCQGYYEQNPDKIMQTMDPRNTEAYIYTTQAITSSLEKTKTTKCSIIASDLILSENKQFADVLVTTSIQYTIIDTGSEEMFTDSSRITFQKTGEVWQSLWEVD